MKEISSKRFRVALLFVMPNGMMMGEGLGIWRPGFGLRSLPYGTSTQRAEIPHGHIYGQTCGSHRWNPLKGSRIGDREGGFWIGI